MDASEAVRSEEIVQVFKQYFSVESGNRLRWQRFDPRLR